MQLRTTGTVWLWLAWLCVLAVRLDHARLAMSQIGAGIEVATAMAPGAFLPLACTANLVKNLAAVSASTTRCCPTPVTLHATAGLPMQHRPSKHILSDSDLSAARNTPRLAPG